VKTDREVMQQALEALMWHDETVRTRGDDEAIAALRARLAKPETCKPAFKPEICKPALQVEEVEVEPAAWMLALPDGRLERLSVASYDDEAKEMLAQSWPGCTMVPLYPAPPARRPLTDEEIWDIAGNCLDSVAGRLQFARAIERKITGGNDE